ncbi:Hint domain-containing protein [Algicola sagamiensis]|uniref:Hint domain-containing protein n=1 Tax=Algicola sagamiensis TaxID=163869 RepID=UPI00036CA82F|nr:Hint domain-containing protein [Algicola sagamiensis]
MKKLNGKVFAASCLLPMLFSFYAEAQRTPILQKRCEQDSLSPAQAIGRTDWSFKCQHISRRTWDFYKHDDFGEILARPMYPIYSTNTSLTDLWKAPVAESSACSKGPNGKFMPQAACVSSCYTPDQKILFAQGELPIFDAYSKRLSKIVTLDTQSTLHSLGYMVRDVDGYSESLKDVEHTILVLKTQNGGQLKVTENHPLLVSTGHMRNAEDIDIGEKLIAENGSFDTVVSIEPIKYFGKVYNVKPYSTDENGMTELNGQIIVAQGFLSGSYYYQNRGLAHVNRLILRDQIPDNLI